MSARQIDLILASHEAVIGRDFQAYRNHCQRTFHATQQIFAQTQPQPMTDQQSNTLAVAAAFHDLGIWTAHTFDYLQPSIALALAYVEKTPEMHGVNPGLLSEMIGQHHQVRASQDALVDAFRRADWLEVSGLIYTRSWGRALLKKYPLFGFHRMLNREFCKQITKDPLHPLPMMKW